MLKKIKLKNSTVLFLGIILIFLGIVFGFYEYFIERKNRTFNEMNILLFENEKPDIIESESELEEKIEENQEETPEEPKPEPIRYDYIGILEIPDLNLKQGFLDINSRYNNVDYNITVIKGSTFPDQPNNNLILASHSGPCQICYFKTLYKLQIGNIAYIYYKNVKHFYKIVNIYEVDKDGTVPIYRDYSKNVLTLITCTKNNKKTQTVYIAELVK